IAAAGERAAGTLGPVAASLAIHALLVVTLVAGVQSLAPRPAPTRVTWMSLEAPPPMAEPPDEPRLVERRTPTLNSAAPRRTEPKGRARAPRIQPGEIRPAPAPAALAAAAPRPQRSEPNTDVVVSVPVFPEPRSLVERPSVSDSRAMPEPRAIAEPRVNAEPR